MLSRPEAAVRFERQRVPVAAAVEPFAAGAPNEIDAMAAIMTVTVAATRGARR